MNSTARKFRRVCLVGFLFLGFMLVLLQISEAGVKNAITLRRINNLSEQVRPNNNRHIESLSRYLILQIPNDRFGYRSLGYGLVDQGRVDEAILAWCNVDDMSVELFHMGQQARRSGRYKDAAQWYQVVEALAPDELENYENQWPLYYYKNLEEGIPSISDLLSNSTSLIPVNQLNCP